MASLDLLQGTLDALILRTLRGEPLHGYAISRWIRERTDGDIDVRDAALYKALRRLERRGCVESEWGRSENNRRARFYRLTARGREQLLEEAAEWQRYARAVSRVLHPLATEAP